MAPRKTPARKSHPRSGNGSPTLRVLADHLGLSPATVSLVINRSPVADSIPQDTQQRILDAARRLNYRPNFMARSLRKQRSFTIGVLVPEISEGYAALVLAGIEDLLLQEGYFYFVASHRHKSDLLDEYPKLLFERSVEGIIAVDTPYRQPLPIPVVAVSGQVNCAGVTRVLLDHARAAELALAHLIQLGHRRIAFIKGQAFSSDTETRWNAILAAAAKHGLSIETKLVAQLQGDSPGPDLGYEVTRRMLRRGERFSALFAFNDVSAIGAVRALREHTLRVPEDVSVIGFDDVQSAAYQNPPLTTVRQPLRKMGELAAHAVLEQIQGRRTATVITVEPQLIVRATTAPARPR